MTAASQDAAPPRMADQVNSLQHFQQHSRLHFIGQWKSRMQDEFQALFVEHPEWNHGRLSSQSTFLHVDLDAFFCSVQLAKKEHEHLRTLPVGIAAGRFNSDISSCNYIARSRGVRAGMYVNAARELCPDLVILGYDLPACERVTRVLYRILFESFTSSHPPVRMSLEVYSIDEVMIATDSTDYDALRGLCERVRDQLFRSTGCTASCGIGPNIMLARLATHQAKPDGVRVIRREDAPAVMRTLPFREIHGAGRATRQKLAKLLRERNITLDNSSSSSGTNLPNGRGDAAAEEQGSASATPSRNQREGSVREDTGGESDRDDDTNEDEGDTTSGILCCHVQRLSREDLQSTLGQKAGDTFYHLCRGEDFRVARRTGDPDEQKALGKTMPASVGCSMNYAVRPRGVEDVWLIVKQLLGEVTAKLKRIDAAAQALRVTLLERNPYYPKEPQKFMGRGPCVEAHVPVRFAHALDASAAELMFEHVKDVLSPLMVMSRAMTDEERGEQLGLHNRPAEGQVIWTVTLASLHDIVVEDLRGMTIQATGLRPRLPESDQPSRKREREVDGQMTLAAAFSKGARHSGKDSGGRAAASPHQELVCVVDDGDTNNVVGSPRRTVHTARSSTPLSATAICVTASDKGEPSSVGDAASIPLSAEQLPLAVGQHSRASSVTLFELFRREWSTSYEQDWYEGCSVACEDGDIPLVTAFLRCALFTLSVDVEGDHSVGREAEDTFAAMVRFVRGKLGGTEVDFA